MQIQGSRIVLTGAASGIGRALLAELAQYDAQIVAADKDGDVLSAQIAALPTPVRARISACTVDLSEAAGNSALFSAALDAMGGIDLFIANAGFAYYERFGEHDDTWGQLERIFRVNVFAPLDALARMRALNTGRSYGVVMTASAQAKIPLPGYAVYAATKAALDAFRSAAQYERVPGETLMLVYPVSTKTNFFSAASSRQTPVFPPAQTPEQVARAVVAGILSSRSHIYPSRLFWLGWMLNRIIPSKWLAQQLGAWQFRRWQKR
jgi:short-subunit dehydrogenase